MTFQQRAIEFFTTTEKTGWGVNHIVEKLRGLSEEKEVPNLVDRRLDRLEAFCALPHLKDEPEISSTPDDDAPL